MINWMIQLWKKRRAAPPLPDPRAYLTQETIWRVEALFPPERRQDVMNLLAFACGCNLPLMERSSPKDLERVRFAVLKLSDGRFDSLCRMIEQALRDWRDVLVGARFGGVEAHTQWRPERRHETRSDAE